MSEETLGDITGDETPPAEMTEGVPATDEGTESPAGSEDTQPVRAQRRKAPRATGVRKPAAKPAARRASKATRKPKATKTAPAAGKRGARQSAAKASPVAGKGKTRGSRKSSKAWSTSKMLKDITARLDLSRRQLTAAMDDLTALVGRQIEAATAPLPRLVRGQWKTPDAIGRLASKLGISSKEKPSTRKRAGTAKAPAAKAAKATAKSRATATPAVSVSLRKRPARTRRKTAS